ncbi:lipoyl domain-containing protein [Devosia enhydra]|uniref:lipoyl domain-containing protein n=1 Tax=Devosia enhydra TaxID=665118 RepID=UPI000930A9E5|nr:lipoyl domain-containing protein [Devosia enhydra]
MELVVPQLGNEITEAEITEWLKAEGDAVTEGEPLLVLTTTKLSMDIEAPMTGVLREIRLPAGELAEVGAVLCVIE